VRYLSIGAAFGACMVAGTLAASDAMAGSPTDPTQLYLSGALLFSDYKVTPGGFNTAGPFSNAFGTDHDSTTGISLAVGLDNLVQFTDSIRLRGELELESQGNPNFVTNSFPGPPGPSTFFYHTDVRSLNGFANLFVDFDMPMIAAPLTAFVGGGIGASNHRVSTNDTVVSGSNSSTEFAWHLGGGLKYAISNNVELFAAARYMDLGKTNTLLNGGANGNYTLKHNVVEARMGMTIKFGPLFGK